MKRAIKAIEEELEERLQELVAENKLLEAQRLKQRTTYDLEMLQQVGFCQGIENYSRHLSGRAAGETPATLLDYFPKDYLMFIDESHVTIPQIRGMYNGIGSERNIGYYGFRLPSALDNRPLSLTSLRSILTKLFCLATPGHGNNTNNSGWSRLFVNWFS